MAVITKIISCTNFVVASSALAFQVFVLYPWHKQLDEDFEKLRKEHMRVLADAGRKSEVPSHREHGSWSVLDAVTSLWKH